MVWSGLVWSGLVWYGMVGMCVCVYTHTHTYVHTLTHRNIVVLSCLILSCPALCTVVLSGATRLVRSWDGDAEPESCERSDFEGWGEDVGLIRGFRIWFCNKFPCCRDDTVFAVSEIFCMITALKFQVLNNKRNLISTRKPSTARSEETPYCSPRAL